MQDDATLLLACAAGNRDAVRRLYERHADQLMGIALRLLRKHDLAEDALHDTFVRIWQTADQFNPAIDRAESWMIAALRDRSLSLLRQREESDGAVPMDAEEAADEERLLVSQAWERLEEGTMLKSCLASLPEDRRRAVLASYVLGLSHGEIAGRMRVPLGTAKAWIRRSLETLRGCMS
ncbi:sigma-70 family RNA polymerase sigma factor [Frigidibacter sp. MR17.14]|uniref:sigma-70 family RNA polymerase sigma factor n=1 Tax=Frigidibacter sp. MR17.14 TaxID=3126509 RepID=UPI003012F47D